MFCVNCGKEIRDNQKFCRYCGTENEMGNVSDSSNAEILKNTQSKQINTVFNRDVLNRYLYNVRLLEIAKSKLYNERNNLNFMINSLGHRQTDYQSFSINDSISDMGSIWGLLIIPVLIEVVIIFIAHRLFIAQWMDESEYENFRFIMICLIIAAVVFGIIVTLYCCVSDANEVKAHNKTAKQDEIRVKNELKEKARLQNTLPGINEEIERLENLCAEAYSVNIIPSKFRNIYAAYFLYDFISTSTASLNEALLHCDLDTIQQKLDEVIRQQEAMIMELAYQNSLNEKIVRQNEQILGYAIQAENNTALAAQYTKIAANNTGVVAAIQMSEYLRP